MVKNKIIVVFNSSPLINLSKIKSLSLIKKIYGEIIIPEAVKKKLLFQEKMKNL